MGGMAYRNGYVHLHSRVGIIADSMPDKPWKENQLHKILVKLLQILFLTQSSQQKFHIFKKQQMRT